ncbi:MFS transporter [Dactylosporangium sp. NBC_01737]|uniref:MFS transporter n=1 Tax=Dactylosporangium sp. NBC_01737 TaxID=2975959 RepID=UPI002E0F593E|nr:MFS transporter [Dactylosporangium sp. NBC_01737]
MPGTKADQDGTVLVDAFAGRPPVAVRPTATAPLGWWPAICVALVAFVDRVEYNLLAGVVPQIQEEFGLSDKAVGAIPTAGAIAGVVLLLPAGRLADTRRRNWIIAAVVGAWAVLTLGTGLAGSYALLFGIRVLLGAAGQLYNPPASSLLADYFPPGGRARAFGLERLGYFVGLPVGVLVGGALAQAVGWRHAFLFVAVPGAVIALLCLTVREPIRGLGDRIGALAAGVTAAKAEAPPAAPMLQQLRDLIRIPTLRSVVAGLTIMFFGLGGLFFWMPTFYQRQFGLEEAAATGIAGGVGGTGIVLGVILGGRYGDRFHGRRKGWRMVLAGTALFIGALGLAVAALAPVLPVQIAGYFVANAGFSAAIPNLTAANADVVPAHRRGLGFAVLNAVVTLGGAAGPFLVGVVSDALAVGTGSGSLRGAFTVLLLPLGLGAWIIRRGGRTFDADIARATGRDADAPHPGPDTATA